MQISPEAIFHWGCGQLHRHANSCGIALWPTPVKQYEMQEAKLTSNIDVKEVYSN